MIIRMEPNSRAINYYIYRSSDTSTSGISLIDSTFTSIYIVRLKNYATYYYRISVRVPEGISYPSAYFSLTRKLNTPDNVKTMELKNGVLIYWNRVRNAQHYEIYRSLSQNSNTKYSTTNDTFFIDTLPAGSPRYNYRISAKNGSTESPLSTDVSGGIISLPQTPAYINIYGQLLAINFNWAIPNGSQPTGFKIYRSNEASHFILIDSTKNNQYFDSVPDSLRYYYRISAYNSLGESSLSNIVSSARTKPSAPEMISASLATSKDNVRIYWSGSNLIKEYAIYRAFAPEDMYSYIGKVQNRTEYYDSSCDVNTNYYYIVKSITPGYQSAGSPYARGIRLGPPEGIGVSQYESGMIVTWKQLPYYVQRYYIYKATSATSPYLKIDSTTQTKYFDTTYQLNNYYKVSSFNTTESDLSGEIKNTDVLIPSPPQSIIATQGDKTNMITISWSTSQNAIGYRVYRSPVDSFTRDISLIAETASNIYTDTIHSDSIYYYRVKAFNQNGENGLPQGAALGYRYPSQEPYPPPKVYIWPNTKGIQISWEKSPTSVGYNKYHLYRAKTENGPFELLTTTNDRHFIDIPPEKSPTVYWYVVKAFNQIGDSGPSEMVSGSQTQ